MLSSQSVRVLNEHRQCSTERQTPGPVAVVRLSAIGDTLIAARSLEILIHAGLDPVFFTFAASEDVARLVPQLRWLGRVEKDGSFCVVNLTSGLEQTAYSPQLILDLQCTGRSQRLVRRLRTARATAQVVRVDKNSAFRFWLILRARLALRQRSNASVPGGLHVPDPGDFVVGRVQRELMFRILTALGTNGSRELSLWSAPKLKDEYSFSHKKYVVFFPGASAPLKTWGADRFRALAAVVLARSQAHLVVLGGPDEVQVAERICAEGGARAVNLAGRVTLGASLALIANAAYVVTGDSFPSHACAAFGVPATVIFGATSPLFGFISEQSFIRVRYAALTCSPCTRHGRGHCRFGNQLCMEQVTVESVVHDLLDAEILA